MKGVPKMYYTNYYAVLEKDYRVKDFDHRVRYIGSPCHSADEARELIYAHGDWGEKITLMCVEDDSESYAEISVETGEILKEFFIKRI